jgi:hypothetical protein
MLCLKLAPTGHLPLLNIFFLTQVYHYLFYLTVIIPGGEYGEYNHYNEIQGSIGKKTHRLY